MQLIDLLPNLKTGGLSTTGFLFGAGTSVEAGYPMMPALTRQVVSALVASDRSALDEVLASVGLAYDGTAGTPNIEAIADHVISHAISTQQPRFHALEATLRKFITDVILSVASPVLDRHVAFLEALKRRAYGQAACVYIFTTNYDPLFELAGAEAGVVIETGFVGAIERFFDPQQFGLAHGLRAGSHFAEHPVLTVRLIKLHGSVSWVARDGRFFEKHPAAIASTEQRVMILPRRRKVMDALNAPHDALFTTAKGTLGGNCKYLVSCGYSFGDDHINENLLRPAVSAGRIRLFALSEEETDGMKQFKTMRAFNAGFKDHGIVKGQPHVDGTDLWKFSRFVELF